ncbi:MAG TPA: TonB-dependent receptor, partial [Longimicrobium sp.]|nr:TonB-dependent receptor [Longimicrobium sp.]
MLSSLVLAFLAAAPAPDTTWGQIRGTVHSQPSGLPIPSALVEVHGGGRTFAVTADSTGAYVLSRIPAGRQLFRVRHLEHEPLEMEVLVPARSQVILDITLNHRPLALDTIQASSSGELKVDGSEAAPRGVSAITDFPAMEGGGVGGGLPGGSPGTGGGTGGEAGDVLYVRGSTADLKLVLLDGAPVYAPFHMGGLIDSFEPGLLAGARLHLGGAPPRYDGGISYVLDLSTRSAEGDRHRAQGSLDMVSARGVVEGPAWRGASYLLAGRLVHGASLARLEGDPFPYEFADALARFDAELGGGVSIALTGFRNGEGVRIDTIPWRENFARWGNGAVSARLRAPVLGSQGEITVAMSDFNAFLPEGGITRLVQKEAHARRARVAVDLTRRVGDLDLAYGWSYDRQRVRHRAVEQTDLVQELLDTESTGTASGWYLEGHWRASRRWVLRGGFRSDMFTGGPNFAFSPRASLTWLLSDRAALTLAGGRYHQFVRVRNEFPFDIGIPNWADSLGMATELAVASANHLSLALDQQLVEGVRLGLEGYYKHFQDVPNPEEVGTSASGVDVWVRRTSGEVTGWLGYSLSWSWSEPDARDRVRLSGRQILSAGVS